MSASADGSTSRQGSAPLPSFGGSRRLPTSVAAARQSFPKQLSDKYRLGEELGRGAYGQVYRGLDARTGEQVAIKQISLDRIPSGALSGIMTEVDLLKALNHRNVVQYLGSLRTRTHLYIIMELVENGSLAAVVKAQQFGPFPEALVGMYIQQVLQGLEYLHHQGVVHRDIKGANILTTKDGVVKLADFGVAARLGDTATTGVGADGGEVVEEDTQPAGTPYWMAPEVVELKTVTTASDVWSVGCVAVELLTGQPPYFDLQPLSALYNIVQNPHPPLPPGASLAMRDFLLQCFKKDPAQRPSAAALLQHPWIVHNRRTLRSTWGRTGADTPSVASSTAVASAVQRILEAEPTRTGPGSVDSAGSEATSPKFGTASLCPSPRSNGMADSGGEIAGGGTPPPTTAGFAPEEDAAVREEFLGRLDADPAGAGLLAQLEGLSLEPGMSLPPPPPVAIPPSPRRATICSSTPLATQAATAAAAEVRRQVGSLRLMATSGRSIVEEAAAAASARALVGYLQQSAALRQVFIAADGLCGLRELLDSPSDRLLGPTLDLLLALTAEDPEAMETTGALGLVPAALRLTGAAHPPELRVRAAQFAEALLRSSASGAHMLVACQGVAFFIGMMDDAPQSPEQVELLRAASSGFWALLHRSQTPGWPLSANAYLRLMAHHGLPQRLVKLLPWVLKLASMERSAHTPPPLSSSLRTSSDTAAAAPVLASRTRTGNRVVPEESLSGGSPAAAAAAAATAAAAAAATTAFSARQQQDSQLLDSLVGLFAVLTHGDSVVKARCCHLDVINPMFGFTVRMPTQLQLAVLLAVKRLSGEQTVLVPLEAANCVAYVVAQLPRQDAPALQVEGLCTLRNLCQLSRPRQEAAAAAGAVPWLCRLAVQPPAEAEGPAAAMAARSAAVTVLCSLAHCSPRTRAELWTHDGLDVLLQLLKEEAHQASVLEAVASWLDAELPRIEGQLLEGTALTRLVMVLPGASNDQLPSLLSPLGRMVSRSSRLAVALAQAGLGVRIVELLRRPSPPTALALMDLLQAMYEAHPNPKEFIAANRVVPALTALAQGAQAGEQVLVRSRATHLLRAFAVNVAF